MKIRNEFISKSMKSDSWVADIVDGFDTLVLGKDTKSKQMTCHKCCQCEGGCQLGSCVCYQSQQDCSSCSPLDRCNNRSFTKGSTIPLKVQATSEKGGVGLFSLKTIQKNEFIIEFTGTRVDASSNGGYVNDYAISIDESTILDPLVNGNEAKYMNHSCRPNCSVDQWTVNGVTRLGVFATQNIAEGEELTFDYKWTSDSGKGTECRCGMIRKKHYIESNLN